jgi:anti-sigma factor RsiW
MRRSFCDDVRDQLDDYLDQEMTPHETRRVREHLEACAGCAALCQGAYRELAAVCARIRTVVVPGSLMRKITCRLACGR